MSKQTSCLRYVWGLLSLTILSNCSSPISTKDSQQIVVTAEDDYCSTVRSISNGVTLTGTAIYYYRATNTTVGALSGNPVSGKISYAEVVVRDSAGTIVQCGTTGAQGEISIVVPKTSATYTVSVNSRSDNAKVHASVLRDITTNLYYTISSSPISVTSSSASTISIGTLSAQARLSEDSELKGGAFNILKDIYKANEFIRNTIGDSTWAAPKVSVFWKAGFNPNSYRDASLASTGLSYYSTGNRKLYILGGISGQVSAVDTDHFDDSVIIHEYGHFLEDVYAKQDSPGGSHNGNYIIDPRLAWSEGWANFMQSAVITNWDETNNIYTANANTARGKYYIDSKGFKNDTVETSSSGTFLIQFDLTLAGGSATGEDLVSTAGEGTFREMSVSRTLYKAISSSSFISLGGDLSFAAIWSAFSSSSIGMASSSAVFRNVGLFNNYLTSIITSSYSSNLTKWNNIVADEKQNTNTVDYGDPLTAQTASCSVSSKTILPVNDDGSCSTSNGTTSKSFKNRSNDYYVYYHDGGNNSITLNYAAASSYSTADLDLYVYQYSHTLFEECYESFGYQFSDFGGAVRSIRRYGSTESGSETVSFSGLPAGYYLVNVKAHTLNLTTATTLGSTYSFQVTTNGTTRNLCPQY